MSAIAATRALLQAAAVRTPCTCNCGTHCCHCGDCIHSAAHGFIVRRRTYWLCAKCLRWMFQSKSTLADLLAQQRTPV